MDYYIMATTPRSGSNHLGSLLDRNHIGDCVEYFSPWAGRPFGAAIVTGLSTEDFAGKLFARLQPARWIGVKLFANDLDRMATNARRSLSPAELLQALFPGAKYLFVRRRDKIEQAISFQRALKTGQWRQAPAPAAGTAAGADIDLDSVHAAAMEFALQERRWRHFFAQSGFQPFEIVYEDLCAFPGETLLATGRFLVGPEFQVSTTTSATQIQRNHETESIKRRYWEKFPFRHLMEEDAAAASSLHAGPAPN